MNQAPLFESLKNTVSDKTDFCALLQPNLQEAPPTPAPFPSNQQTAPTISATGLTAYSLFPPFFPGHALPIISHLAATGAIPIYSANERKRFTPSPFSTRKGVSPPPLHPSSGSKLLSLLCFFSSMQHHPNDFSLSPTLTAEGRIRSSVSSPAEFLTSKPAQPPKDCAGSFFSLFMLPLRFLFLPSVSKKIPRRRLAASISAATQTQPKPLIKRQHPYRLPDKPRRQPSEAVNPFLKILIKASEPLFSASPQSSGLAARASPAPPASSSHRSGFPPRSAARPSAWPVLPLHRSK